MSSLPLQATLKGHNSAAAIAQSPSCKPLHPLHADTDCVARVV